MSTCAHLFADPRHSCPHPAIGGGDRCLWHHRGVSKAEPYVRDLMIVALSVTASQPDAWAETHLCGLDLSGMDLRGRSFRGADLRDARLDDADVRGVDFSGADLRRATMRRIQAQGARFTGARLMSASLLRADVREANFSEAVFDETVLLDADLRGADLGAAQVRSFHWNRLTRFAGVTGFEPDTAAHELSSVGDSTRVFIAPLALGDLSDEQRFQQDPELHRTRYYELEPMRCVTADPLTATPPRRGWLPVVVPALVGLLIGGLIVTGAWWSTGDSNIATSVSATIVAVDDGSRQRRLAELESQHQADLTELSAVQDKLAAALADAASHRQQTTIEAARAEALRSEVLDLQAELARTIAQADRAVLAQVDARTQAELSRELAMANAKQDRIATILADGMERMRSDNQRLAAEAKDATGRLVAMELTQADNVRLNQAILGMRQERDTLTALYQKAQAELITAKRDIDRYLARIQGSQLESLLTGDEERIPVLPLTLGTALSLGGDYLVSLTVDQATSTTSTSAGVGQLSLQLVVQRPTGAANPDATVVLYDAQKRPLRRVAASFPHVDRGSPFVRMTAQIACDRVPAFARVILAPGIDDVALR